jgi:hypothetical protein
MSRRNEEAEANKIGEEKECADGIITVLILTRNLQLILEFEKDIKK